jgi:(1->4)-alpha-D-glucan 1-alpha-D-glucosylmutase
VQGERQTRVIALARCLGEDWVLGVAGRFFTEIARPGQPPLGREAWGETLLLLPPEAPRQWQDVFTGKTCAGDESAPSPDLPLRQIFQHLPVALLSGHI